MFDEQFVGGLRCGDVLSLLSDFVDGTLPGGDRERVETHLRGCDLCERFGGEFSATVRALRSSLADSGSIDGEVAERLRRRLTSTRGR